MLAADNVGDVKAAPALLYQATGERHYSPTGFNAGELCRLIFGAGSFPSNQARATVADHPLPKAHRALQVTRRTRDHYRVLTLGGSDRCALHLARDTLLIIDLPSAHRLAPPDHEQRPVGRLH